MLVCRLICVIYAFFACLCVCVFLQLDRYRAQLSDSTRVGHELALQVKGLEAQLGSANRMSDRYKETAEELQVSIFAITSILLVDLCKVVYISAN